MTIVMVSHDIAPALEHATRVLDMGKETVLGTEVTVVGTFDTYNEGQYQYCILKNAQLL